MSAPVPARAWHSTRATEYTLNIERTDLDASGVRLWISDPYDGVSVLLNRAQTGELVTDLLRRLVLIGGRHAALCAAADPSIADQRSRQAVSTLQPGERCPRCDSPDPARHPAIQSEGEVQPCPDGWHVSGRDALRGPESAETGLPGALTPPDPRSHGSADGGGAR